MEMEMRTWRQMEMEINCNHRTRKKIPGMRINRKKFLFCIATGITCARKSSMRFTALRKFVCVTTLRVRIFLPLSYFRAPLFRHSLFRCPLICTVSHYSVCKVQKLFISMSRKLDFNLAVPRVLLSKMLLSLHVVDIRRQQFEEEELFERIYCVVNYMQIWLVMTLPRKNSSRSLSLLYANSTVLQPLKMMPVRVLARLIH